MAGLFSILQSNYQAINANSLSLALTGKNLNNINNTGYSRQSVELGSLGMIPTPQGVQSMGVSVIGIKQARDILLDTQVRNASSAMSYLTSKQTGLTAAQTALGEQIDRTTDASAVGSTSTNTATGVANAISKYFSSMESLSTNPSNPGQQQLLLQNSTILVDTINSADVQLTQVQTDLTNQATADVTTVNQILAEISGLNTAIGTAENGKPGTALDLRDQREAKVEELAKYMNVTVADIPGGGGQVSVSASDASGNPVYLVNPTLTGPLTFDGTHFSAGATPTVLKLTSGSLQAQVDTRDGAVATTRAQLATLANQLTTSVNAAYNSASTAGMNFFSATPASGLIQLDVTAATLRSTTTGTAGGNELAVAVANLANKKFSTGSGDLIDGTFSSYYAGAVSNLGLALSNTNNRLADQTLIHSNAVSNRDSLSGVSQDEELTNMLQFQRAYQACAHFQTVIDSLLGALVTGS